MGLRPQVLQRSNLVFKVVKLGHGVLTWHAKHASEKVEPKWLWVQTHAYNIHIYGKGTCGASVANYAYASVAIN